MINQQWTMNDEQGSINNEQWMMNNEQGSTIIKE